MAVELYATKRESVQPPMHDPSSTTAKDRKFSDKEEVHPAVEAEVEERQRKPGRSAIGGVGLGVVRVPRAVAKEAERATVVVETAVEEAKVLRGWWCGRRPRR